MGTSLRPLIRPTRITPLVLVLYKRTRSRQWPRTICDWRSSALMQVVREFSRIFRRAMGYPAHRLNLPARCAGANREYRAAKRITSLIPSLKSIAIARLTMRPVSPMLRGEYQRDTVNKPVGVRCLKKLRHASTVKTPFSKRENAPAPVAVQVVTKLILIGSKYSSGRSNQLRLSSRSP